MKVEGLSLASLKNQFPKLSNTSGYFWQITDPHLDSEYVVGSVANCGQLVCCRKNSPRTNGTVQYAERFGTYAPCDVPLETFVSALEFIKNFPVEGDFVFYGGDNLVHDDWNYSKEYNLNYAILVANALRVTLQGSRYQNRVIPAIGNHDLAPINMYPLDPKMNEWYLHPVGDAFQFSFSSFPDGDAALASFKTSGYFTLLIEPGFRAVVLNTQFQNPLNFWLLSTPDRDPGKQLAWLDQVLGKAQQANEKVVILGHIPPGIDTGDFMEESTGNYNDDFSNLVAKYSSILVGQFYGHTHNDHFKLFQDPKTNAPTGVAWVTPAITQWLYHNPAFRLIQYNKKTLELENLYTFTANLTDAKDKLTWTLEYDALTGYGIPDLSPQTMTGLLYNKLNAVESYWNKFALRFTGGYPYHGLCSFHEECKTKRICAMGNMQYSGYDKCIKAAGSNSKRGV
ncbi:hypothetical protein FDP41_013358 [Naegleria fowleri]|uniref:Sphingomyelin phosphodiesterase C-terminal domain-containing protein n=1 Tax=Naegleria fowleri TaxID=5763 RepID=A0A6A5C0N2_NAEFO|nr:uncharacterized protein FDP41_013358 [Naegleria fowleri]KAF0980144.1 hypothetical protein FDP41_013358 [Naegleria fowleri]CAG4714640.1 unnamed protein product [Naegleria fowleri]